MKKTKLQAFKKPFVIVGAGKSGLAAHALLLECGIEKNEVYLFDEKKEIGLKNWSDVENLNSGTLVVSPGVPLQSPMIKNLVQKGWMVTSEISLACLFLSDEKIIGITGSVAKSTVTTLIGLAASEDDENAFIGGNLGVPFCDYVIRLLQTNQKAKWIILELSSYQLENCKGLKLEHSAITYLSANHLERYKSIDEYYLTKCNISEMTRGTCVLNGHSSDNLKYKTHIKSNVLVTDFDRFLNKEILSKIKLLGSHNRDNFCIAYELAKLAGFTDKAILKMTNFKGLPHRIEFVAEHKEVIYINDSKATAMDSVLVAAAAAQEICKDGGTVRLLLGGKDKNLPWEDLKILNSDKKIKIYYFGECGQIAKEKMQNTTASYFNKLDMALDEVFSNAKACDVVLLSPGGTSLDEFKNFEERGNHFKDKVFKFIQKNV